MVQLFEFVPSGEQAVINAYNAIGDAAKKSANFGTGTVLKTEAWKEALEKVTFQLDNATSAQEKLNAQQSLSALLTQRPKTFGDRAGAAVGGFLRSPFTGSADVAGRAAGAVSTAALSPLQGVAGAMAKITTGLVAPFSALTATLGAATGPLESFVGKLNPALVMAMDYAMSDLMATIGQQLQPVLQAAVGVVQKIGDAVANVDFGPLADSLGRLITALGEGFTETLQALEPIINLAVDGLSLLLDGLTKFVKGLTFLIGKLNDNADASTRKVRATASRGTSFHGLEDVSRMASQAAGRVGAAAHAKSTAENTAKTVSLLEELLNNRAAEAAAEVVSNAINALSR